MTHLSRTLQAARAFLAEGFCVIPVKADGSKAPALPSWGPYQQRLSTEEELQTWFGGTPQSDCRHGIGVIWGKVSGHGEALDFDEPGLFERFAGLCEEQGLGRLLGSLPLIETPSGGRHLLWRCSEPVEASQKLAQRLTEVPEGTAGARRVESRWCQLKTLIETRGEGGYTLAPGSPEGCHPAGKPYRFLHGRPETVPVITPGDRRALLALAGAFTEYVTPDRIVAGPRSASSDVGLRPGDDYNRRDRWQALLERHGWTMTGETGGKTFWRRPGKDGPGISATDNYAGSGLFYVFSSNAAPFEPQRAYTPFSVFTLLEHGGDYSSAAQALREQGYGDAGYGDAGYGDECGSSPRKRSGHAVSPIPVPPMPVPPDTPWEPPVPFSSGSLPAFPVDALPPVIATFVREIARSAQVPADMAGMMALSVIAAASARTCMIRVGETHEEPLNLYVVTVMEPGSRKSQTLEAMAAPLRRAEKALAEEWAPRIAAALEKKAVEEKRRELMRNQAAKGDEEERRRIMDELTDMASGPSPVVCAPRLLADDVTPERMVGLLAEGRGKMAIFSAEGGIFGILGGRYSEGKANLDLFLKGHSGEEYRVDRQGREPEFIPLATITMGLAVQPDVLGSLTADRSFRGRGLLGRFLYSLPKSLAGTRFYGNYSADRAAGEAYDAALQAILHLPDPSAGGDAGARHCLHLQGEALHVWARFHDEAEKRQAPGQDLAGMRDWASKLAGAVARIAGGFHLVGQALGGSPWDQPVGAEDVERACAIGRYLIPHAQAAFSRMGMDPAVLLAESILAWIDGKQSSDQKQSSDEERSSDGKECRQGMTFTRRECHQAHRSVPSGSALDAALAVLIDHGYIRQEVEAVRNGPGRKPSPRYRVNPLSVPPSPVSSISVPPISVPLVSISAVSVP